MPEASPMRRDASADETARANRTWWDGEAPDYVLEHGEFLGADEFVWGPEGWTEDELGLLGEVRGRDLLEIGSGAAQCSRWVAARGGRVVATDLSIGMLRVGQDLNLASRTPAPLAQCDATLLPFGDGSFDTVFTAYGAVPFVADSRALMVEVARVLRPGGLFAFSTTHPVRWAFPDDPSERGLTATMSYWDRTPYVESDDTGRASYVEHHRTLGDRVRELAQAGFVLQDVVEPEWKTTNPSTWGGWSPTRGAILPGTAIFIGRRAPASPP